MVKYILPMVKHILPLVKFILPVVKHILPLVNYILPLVNPTDRPNDRPNDRPTNRIHGTRWRAKASNGKNNSSKMENGCPARVGIRGVFAVICGGYSRGIRGYSRAFAPLMLVCDAKDLDVEIGISPQFHDSFPRRDPPPDHPPKTRNPCRADPIYNTNNEI